MKKLLYLSLALSLFSCSSSDDTPADTPPPPVIQTEKAYTYCSDGAGTLNPKEFYEFTFENDKLTNIKGRFYPIYVQFENLFFADHITKLFYTNNKVVVSQLEEANAVGHNEYHYTMDNNRLSKKEHYYVNNSTGTSSLSFAKTYTYEQDKLKSAHLVFPGPGNYEYFTTYYYDNSSNLTKSEFLERINGVDNKMTTTIYSDFDSAANPFKKLYLINDTFFEKSLSVNNFRKKETTVVNLVLSIPPKTSIKTWNYKYDANGQILLYFPVP